MLTKEGIKMADDKDTLEDAKEGQNSTVGATPAHLNQAVSDGQNEESLTDEDKRALENIDLTRSSVTLQGYIPPETPEPDPEKEAEEKKQQEEEEQRQIQENTEKAQKDFDNLSPEQKEALEKAIEEQKKFIGQQKQTQEHKQRMIEESEKQIEEINNQEEENMRQYTGK